MNDNYEEIINLPHHVSKKHTPMSMWNRAAQFAPFAALTGFEEKIDSKNKIKMNKKLLSNDIKDDLDNKLHLIEEHLDKEIEITYYDNDKYIKIRNYINKIDKINKKIILVNKNIIDSKNIIDLRII